jgi:hypothetical protein
MIKSARAGAINSAPGGRRTPATRATPQQAVAGETSKCPWQSHTRTRAGAKARNTVQSRTREQAGPQQGLRPQQQARSGNDHSPHQRPGKARTYEIPPRTRSVQPCLRPHQRHRPLTCPCGGQSFYTPAPESHPKKCPCRGYRGCTLA